jgi:hypothetical protein
MPVNWRARSSVFEKTAAIPDYGSTLASSAALKCRPADLTASGTHLRPEPIAQADENSNRRQVH